MDRMVLAVLMTGTGLGCRNIAVVTAMRELAREKNEWWEG